ncbi:hypothetical protein H4Q26_013037 [Puccinia striiformis f. sp. tritici PST-130]|nr:hypothetical protein H4Q26_013037 [Puccinia striiformis f. sp. tritici PST-130]
MIKNLKAPSPNSTSQSLISSPFNINNARRADSGIETGFTILRSVLAKFCFINETVLVTTLSLLSQVDIRTVPMFSTTRSSDPPGTSPLMFKDDLQGVVRSIRGIPNELVTGDVTNHHCSTKISLCSPLFQENMTSIYVKEWLNLRMELQDDRWKRNAWGQRRCQSETPGDGTKTDMIPSSPEAPVSPHFLSPQTYSASVKRPDHMEEYRQFHLQLLDMIIHPECHRTYNPNDHGEMVPSTSPRIPANHLTDTPFECFFEDDPTSTTASLYCYDDALEEVVLNLASITDSFLMNFRFDQYSNLSHSKQAEDDSGRCGTTLWGELELGGK